MNRQNSSAVLELKEKRAPRRCLKPRAMVIGGVVVADRGMISTNSELEIITVGILKDHSLDIHSEGIIFAPCFAKNVVRPTFKDNFAEEFEFFRDVRSDEKVELAKAEGGRIVPLAVPVKRDIAEAAHAQQCLASIHPLRHRVVCLLLSITYRRGIRLGRCGRKAYRGSLLLGRFQLLDSSFQLINSLKQELQCLLIRSRRVDKLLRTENRGVDQNSQKQRKYSPYDLPAGELQSKRNSDGEWTRGLHAFLLRLCIQNGQQTLTLLR